MCATGLLILTATYATMTMVDRETPVAVVEAVPVLLGVGTALVVAPTTEIVMASVLRERAGAGAALNSAVRSVGGALGIAVLGSVLSTAYRARIDEALGVLPPGAREAAGESIGGTQVAVSATHNAFADHGASLLDTASQAFA